MTSKKVASKKAAAAPAEKAHQFKITILLVSDNARDVTALGDLVEHGVKQVLLALEPIARVSRTGAAISVKQTFAKLPGGLSLAKLREHHTPDVEAGLCDHPGCVAKRAEARKARAGHTPDPSLN